MNKQNYTLLKLKAFLADKLNYNLDKNTLENFPSQATQRGNAQKLYDILGYNMKYYKSATTKITMRYRPVKDKELPEDYEPVALLIVGYAEENVEPHKGHFMRKDIKEIVF